LKGKIAAVFLLLFSVVVPLVLAQDENTPGTTPTPTPTPTPGVEVTPAPTETEPPDAATLPGLNMPEAVGTPTPSETPEETTNGAGEGVNPETGQAVVDEETGQEIVAMQLGPGAKVRLLELERAVIRNILKGKKVVEFIQENDSNADVADLGAVLAELESLKEEIALVQPQANSDETVKQFVDLKNDAISLSKEFRDTARGMLEGMDKSGLAAKFKEIDWSELKALNDQIRQLIREYNAQRVERVFQNIEGKAPAFVQRIRAGEMSVKQVRAELVKAFKALRPVQKNKVFQHLKQLNAKRRVFRKAKTAVAGLNFLERRAKRLENRIQRIKQNPTFKAIMSRIRDRMNRRLQNTKSGKRGVRVNNQGFPSRGIHGNNPLKGIAGPGGGA